MLKVLVDGQWVEQIPVEGDIVREYRSIGTDNEHYIQYTHVTPVAPVEDRRVTKLAFKNRMTQAERIAVRVASASDAIIYDFMDLVSDAQFIDLDRADTQAGVNYLEAQGHLAVGRASEILNNPIQEEERP